MLNITKQYMNKALSGRTYEKTGYKSLLHCKSYDICIYKKFYQIFDMMRNDCAPDGETKVCTTEGAAHLPEGADERL